MRDFARDKWFPKVEDAASLENLARKPEDGAPVLELGARRSGPWLPASGQLLGDQHDQRTDPPKDERSYDHGDQVTSDVTPGLAVHSTGEFGSAEDVVLARPHRQQDA